MTDRREMEAVIEAVLFVTSEPISRGRFEALFPGQEEAVAEALEAVLGRYSRSTEDADGRGIMVDEVGGGVRLVTRPELSGFLRRFFSVSGSNRLSMAALETLAIVAYRQPITAPEIQELRCKNSSTVLKTLLENRLVRISGRKEVVGKPFLYSTTREFLLRFGLDRLKDLPPLEELEEVLAEGGEVLDPQGELSINDEALESGDGARPEAAPSSDDAASGTADDEGPGALLAIDDEAAIEDDTRGVAAAAGPSEAEEGAEEPGSVAVSAAEGQALEDGETSAADGSGGADEAPEPEPDSRGVSKHQPEHRLEATDSAVPNPDAGDAPPAAESVALAGGSADSEEHSHEEVEVGASTSGDAV